ERPSAGPLPVVVKLRRLNPALNSSDEAIGARFNREQRALRDLATQLEQSDAEQVPASWTAAGEGWGGNESLRVSLPVLHGLAANHALAVPDHADWQHNPQEALRQVVGADPTACVGCGMRGTADPADRSPIPPGCRPWVVGVQELAGWDETVVA